MKNIDISTWVWLIGGFLIFFNQLLNLAVGYFHDKATKEHGKYEHISAKLDIVKKYSDNAVAAIANDPIIPKSESKDAAVTKVVESLKFAGVNGISVKTIESGIEKAYQGYKAKGYDNHVDNGNVVPESVINAAMKGNKESSIKQKPQSTTDENDVDIDPVVMQNITQNILSALKGDK